MPSKSKAKALAPKGSSKVPSQQTSSTANIPAVNPANASTVTEGNLQTKSNLSKGAQPLSSDPAPSHMPQLSEDGATAASGVNRKKQKRRMKEAAKRAASQSADVGSQIGNLGDTNHTNGYDYGDSEYDGPEQYGPAEGEDVYYTDEAGRNYDGSYTAGQVQTNGYSNHNYISQEPLGAKKKKKTQKNAKALGSYYNPSENLSLATHGHFQRPPPPPPPLSDTRSTSVSHAIRNGSRDRIWNTSTAEERERIKEFWLSLGEEDRRGLVRIEKEAVLKKMKEQQKHSCSCTVCGRKRIAIEEELEVLYDAYYEELETYANHQQFSLDASPIPPTRQYRRPPAPLPLRQNLGLRSGSARARVEELGDEDDAGDEEEFSDEDEDEDISDDDLDPPLAASGGIFNFGNSLTAQGGILTVADDLLKNDGKKFIEMMEQLAERRMQREEESRMVAGGHGYPPISHRQQEEDEDGYEDEEDEEDYNSEEDEEFEDDEMEAMTEEQRMEEGRRMFQIFAARMFEQRVLNAYRQKVAEERQKKLIEELAEDEQLDAQREAKKAKEAQKKKDKRQKAKQAKDEERAKKEAEKAAEEAALREIETKKAEEQRQRKEEQRKKKEAEKRAAEEERKRKEEERSRQIQEKKEQQAEQERKQREQKDREKKKREDSKRKEREERDAKEQEARAKKEREASDRREREAKMKSESEAKERLKLEEATAKQAASAPKRQSPASVVPVPTPHTASLLPPNNISSHPSPRLPIATPALPKPPTPGRVRQKSFQGSRTASPKPSQAPSSSTASPAASLDQQPAPLPSPLPSHSRKSSQPGAIPPLPLQQPRFSPVGPPPGIASQPPGFHGMTPMPNNTFPSNFGPTMSPMTPHAQLQHPPGFPNQYPMGSNHFRNPNMPYPPSLNTARPYAAGQPHNIGQPTTHGPGSHPPSSVNNMNHFGAPHETKPSYTHSRNPSGSSSAISRDPHQAPAPIQRPSSVTPHQAAENVRPMSRDVDDLSNHLSSRSLLKDSEPEKESPFDDLRRGSVADGGPRTQRQGPGAIAGLAPIGTSARMDKGSQAASSMWSNQSTPFGAPNRGAQPFSSAPGFGRPTNSSNAFGAVGGGIRPNAPRALRVRLLVCNICQKMSNANPASAGWHVADQVLQELQPLMPRNEPMIFISEMLELCDTEGNHQNGGGWFESKGHPKGYLLKHHTNEAANDRGGNPLGEIGSPISAGSGGGNSLPPIGGQASYQQHGGFPPSSGFST